MKKITLLFAAFVATAFMTAQTTLSHSTTQDATIGSVACANNTTGFTLANSYWRTYKPSNFGFTGSFTVRGAEFGWAFTDVGGTTPTINVNVNIYTTTGTFPSGTRTLVGTQVVAVGTAENLTVVPVMFTTPFEINSNNEIVVEINIPSGEVPIFNARVAQNADGQDAPSYLSSPGCGNIPPTPISDLGAFPDSNIIVNLVGGPLLSVDDKLASLVKIYPNPTADVLFLKTPSNIVLTSAVLFDVLGRNTGVEFANGQLDTSNLASGIYMLQVNSDAGSLTQKIIKQ